MRAAERRLAAATAEVGVAKGEWFPKFSISASGGYEALRMADLFKSTSQTWALAPFISWRILDGGTIRAQIRAAEARQELAGLAYEQAVLTALGDGERALSGYRLALEALQAQRGALDSARRGYQYAQQRFQGGDIALAELLEVENRVHEAEDGFARTQTTAAIDLVALCKALGGGWPSAAGARNS